MRYENEIEIIWTFSLFPVILNGIKMTNME